VGKFEIKRHVLNNKSAETRRLCSLNKRSFCMVIQNI
jgi:hypothetical protein